MKLILRGLFAGVLFITLPVMVAQAQDTAGELPASSETQSEPDGAKDSPRIIGEQEKTTSSAFFPLSHIGGLQSYTTVYEDTFLDIARRNNLGFVELRAANPDIDPWMPGEGRELSLPTMHLIPDAPQKGIIINLAEMRLYHFPAKGDPKSFPIGIGRAGLSTPLGQTHVRAKTEGPTWRPTKRMREEDPSLPTAVPPGPDNPLGSHMIYLGWPEYGIHGTNKPYGIGRRVSSGCIRMYPEGILALYPVVSVDDPVTVVDQPVKVAWVDNDLYIEAHPTTGQADRIEADGGLPGYKLSDQDLQLILATAAQKSTVSLDWPLIRRVIRQRQGIPVRVAVYEVASPDKSSEAGDNQTDNGA